MADVQRETLLLITYATLDHDIAQLTDLLSSVPTDLEAAQIAQKSIQNDLATLTTSQADWEKERRDLESEEAHSITHLEERKARLQGIHNMKEYQAALKEVEEITRSRKAREDRLLELLERLRQVEPKIAELTAALGDKTAATNALQAKWENDRRESEQSLAQKRLDREACARDLDPSLLKRYQQIANLRTPAVAIIEKGICLECNVQLPPQQYLELKRSKGFQHCPNCQRLGYIPTVPTA